jgi:hypothetical protein
MRPSRHQKAAMPDPTPARVRKRKSEVSEEGAADKPHACSHCGKRFGALAAMWGHQSRCAARSQNLNLEPHPFDRPKTAGKVSRTLCGRRRNRDKSNMPVFSATGVERMGLGLCRVPMAANLPHGVKSHDVVSFT